jgi:hypothetical protein
MTCQVVGDAWRSRRYWAWNGDRGHRWRVLRSYLLTMLDKCNNQQRMSPAQMFIYPSARREKCLNNPTSLRTSVWYLWASYTELKRQCHRHRDSKHDWSDEMKDDNLQTRCPQSDGSNSTLVPIIYKYYEALLFALRCLAAPGGWRLVAQPWCG